MLRRNYNQLLRDNWQSDQMQIDEEEYEGEADEEREYDDFWDVLEEEDRDFIWVVFYCPEDWFEQGTIGSNKINSAKTSAQDLHDKECQCGQSIIVDFPPL